MKWPAPTFKAFQTVEACCQREKLLAAGDLVLAGISGGLDSIFLLNFLAAYREKIPFTLIACHLNHMIRDREADLDQALAASSCQALAIPFYPVKVDVPAYAARHKMGLEAAGREVRRQAFLDLGGETMAQGAYQGELRVALAHHMDDRAESILMHLGRGTGLGGLVGIRYREGPFIRPLLDLRRQTILEAARAAGLVWREDASNLSDDFLRNRIRNHLIPVWQDCLGYDPLPALIRMSHLAQADQEALASLAASALKKASLPDKSLALADLEALPPALAGRVLQLWYAAWLGKEGINPLTAGQVDRILTLTASLTRGDKKQASLSLPGGLTARLAHGRLWLEGLQENDEPN